MPPALHHECIRAPVTALAGAGSLLLAAEGPYVRFYQCQDSSQFTLLGSKAIFKDQAIHGISVQVEDSSDVTIAIWGGPLVRFIRISHAPGNIKVAPPFIETLQLSPVARAPDWILHLSFGPADSPHGRRSNVAVCAAVTAHNALIQITVQRLDCAPGITELSSSSRSILYSAHLLWHSLDHILVAAGTAFGEIMFWSWTRDANAGHNSCVHRVFLGHEGSIFGVRISHEFEGASGQRRRYLASCSDDRTIRIWDISGISTSTAAALVDHGHADAQRTRHTGFSNPSVDADASDSTCMAIGWGHTSRVWAIQFLESQSSQSSVFLVSAGEDATSRAWQFTPTDEPSSQPLVLEQLGNAAYHNGKNLWSLALFGTSADARKQVICGAADSKVTAHTLPASASPLGANGNSSIAVKEYSIQDIITIGEPHADPQQNDISHKSSKLSEFFRSYAFIDDKSFLLTTNSGKVFLETLGPGSVGEGLVTIAHSQLLGRIDELAGYSICAADSALGVGFVAGSRGSIYMYHKESLQLLKIHTVQGKIGSMFIAPVSAGANSSSIVLLITLMGRKTAQLIYINMNELAVFRTFELLIQEHTTGSTITSMAYIATVAEDMITDVDYVFMGFRAGFVAAYALPRDITTSDALPTSPSIARRMHGKETVTAMIWHPSPSDSSIGHLVSAGRDGCVAVHNIDFNQISQCGSQTPFSLLHNVPLPIGPNLEGLYHHYGHLIVYGFSSTDFIVYDLTTEEEIMSVETGGSHRSWSFQPCASRSGGGTLVWTRASSMHVCTQKGANHQVLRSGGHGREIKSVAVSHGIGGYDDASSNDSKRTLIATGAEDTDIKLFEYVDGDFVCRRTLRKHNTGIQHLAWSDDGAYLFSSGGGEEFCVWRVRALPCRLGVDVGVVCEAVCPPESEGSDVRLTAFDVRRRDSKNFVISMVFSDSVMRIYNYTSYDATGYQAGTWQLLGKGIYFTSCLTQTVFLSSSTILTIGTDGHAVLWHVPDLPSEYHASGAAAPPISLSSSPPSSASNPKCQSLTWQSPTRIHQNTSQTLVAHALDPNRNTQLLVSGGDDGSLAFLLLAASPSATPLSSPSASSSPSLTHKPSHPPTILIRAHASAITACAIIPHDKQIYVVSAGNDQWVRVWEVCFNTNTSTQHGHGHGHADEDGVLSIKRVSKTKTNVADVSSMALLFPANREGDGEKETAGGCAAPSTKIIICGVGMEVLALEWDGDGDHSGDSRDV